MYRGNPLKGLCHKHEEVSDVYRGNPLKGLCHKHEDDSDVHRGNPLKGTGSQACGKIRFFRREYLVGRLEITVLVLHRS